MTKKTTPPLNVLVREQAAKALLKATYDFLRRNNINGKATHAHKWSRSPIQNDDKDLKLYREAMRAYENMGVLMATWFSNLKFLDSFGNPMALTASRGPRSISNLIRQSGVRISAKVAIELLRS